jgi:hypothetical protein
MEGNRGKRLNKGVQQTWEGRKMLSSSRDEEGIGEGQTPTKTSGLEADADVLGGRQRGTMREADKTSAILRTGHAVAAGQQLLGDSTMADDHTRDSRGMIGTDEDARGGGQRHRKRRGQRRLMISRNAKETNTFRMMRVVARIVESHLTVRGSKRSVGVE